MTEWRNRIVKEGSVSPAQIRANPRNWRVHPKLQRETITDSLGSIGWIQKPIVNLRSGYLIDGHLRVAAALERGEASIPVCYVDLDPEEERAALASLDPLAGMAVADSEKLDALLEGLAIGGGALNRLFDELREQAEGGMLAAATPGEERDLGKGPPLVKAALLVADLLTVENAISATGLMNRGEALLTICKSYLNAKGQHDVGPQDLAALLAPEAGSRSDRAGDSRGARADLGAGLQRSRPGRGVRAEAGKG